MAILTIILLCTAGYFISTYDKLELEYIRKIKGIPIGKGESSVDLCLSAYFDGLLNGNRQAYHRVVLWDNRDLVSSEVFMNQGDLDSLTESYLEYSSIWEEVPLQDYLLKWDENIYCRGIYNLSKMSTLYGFIHGVTIYQSDDIVKFVYPSLILNRDLDLLGFAPQKTIIINLERKAGRWYIVNPGCAQYLGRVPEVLDYDSELITFPENLNAKDFDAFADFIQMTSFSTN